MEELTDLQALLEQPFEDEYLPDIKDWFLSILRRDIQENIGPSFWAMIPVTSEIDEKDEDVLAFISATDMLFDSLQPYMNISDKICQRTDAFDELSSNEDPNSFQVKVQTIIRALLLYQMPVSFQRCVRQFYLRAFWSFHGNKVCADGGSFLDNSGGDNSDMNMDETTDEEGEMAISSKGDSSMSGHVIKSDQSSNQDIMRHFHRINKNLFAAGLLERVCGEAVTSIINDRIEQFVEERCKGEFEQSFIADLEQWLSNQVMGWLRTIFNGDQTHLSLGESPSRTLSKWKERLTYFLYQTYAKLRIRELFNIIVEYPDSQPALQDLKECLGKTDLRSHLIQSLRIAMETRLLHPGVNTADILTQYVSSIRALQVLDSAGVVLERVCEPVRSYLRTRDDTVRCIVSSLTEEGNSDLAEELAKSNPLNIQEVQGSDDCEEEGDPFKWEPDPVDADPSHKTNSKRSADILSMLVNIYGSRELFVNEYRSLLADRILTHFNFDTDREVRNLELLKLRFGETQLHHCEVMLKDVADSRRCNINIKSSKRIKKDSEDKENKGDKEEEAGKDEEEEAVDGGVDETDEEKKENLDFKAMILSAQFWPNLKEEKLVLHNKVESQLEKYRKSYEALKATRTLIWKPHLGQVTLDLELKDRTLSLSVSPLHATIIMHFEEKDRWTIQELSSVMQVPSTTLRRKIAFWQSQGVLKEDPPDCFTLVEEDSGRASKETDDVLIDSDDDVESATTSTQSETLQVFWSYIEGMLTNLNSLPIERIHAMLKMFAMPGPNTSEISEHELKLFLDKKVREQELVFSGGVYKLPKSDGSL